MSRLRRRLVLAAATLVAGGAILAPAVTASAVPMPHTSGNIVVHHPTVANHLTLSM